MTHRRYFISLASLFVLFLCLAYEVSAQSFTLEQVMSSPFPSDPTVSKRGEKIAWAFDAEGKRNVWVAEAPSFAARQLTQYNTDDGQELSDLTFSPNANFIAFVRGGDENEQGAVPNPTSDPSGSRQLVWVVNVRTGRTTEIGEGSGPFFNAAGDQVLYMRDRHFWSAPVIGGRWKRYR